MLRLWRGIFFYSSSVISNFHARTAAFYLRFDNNCLHCIYRSLK